MSRTVINLDDRLVREAKRLTGLKKKVQVVNLALAELVHHHRRTKILELRGKIRWKGNLDEMRRSRW